MFKLKAFEGSVRQECRQNALTTSKYYHHCTSSATMRLRIRANGDSQSGSHFVNRRERSAPVGERARGKPARIASHRTSLKTVSHKTHNQPVTRAHPHRRARV